MTFNEFVKLFNGKATDFDKGCGVQCVDLIKMYNYYVLGITPQAIGNAEAYWRRYDELPYLKNNFIKIQNTPEFIPQKRRYSSMGYKTRQIWTRSFMHRRRNNAIFLFIRPELDYKENAQSKT